MPMPIFNPENVDEIFARMEMGKVDGRIVANLQRRTWTIPFRCPRTSCGWSSATTRHSWTAAGWPGCAVAPRA